MILKIHYRGDSGVLNYEYERDSVYTFEDEFTSDSTEEDEQEIQESIEELVLMLNEPEEETESSDEDQLVDEKLTHLKTKDAEAVKMILRDYPEVIANSFENVTPSTVSVTHRFELTSENPIYQKARRISPSHNDIVHNQIDCMLAAGVAMDITACYLHKKNGPSRFCVDYRN